MSKIAVRHISYLLAEFPMLSLHFTHIARVCLSGGHSLVRRSQMNGLARITRPLLDERRIWRGQPTAVPVPAGPAPKRGFCRANLV